MLSQYHRDICQRALESKFSSRALEIIIKANIAQDNLHGLVGHHEYHFDDNAFEAGYAYLEEQRNIILAVLSDGGNIVPARKAFGRLTHAVQDFYAHCNYLELWAQSFAEDELPPPHQVDALNQTIINHPDLRSGRIYFREVLAFIPFLRPFTRRILPADSHANMNIDYPERGAFFPYAIEAAVKRTLHEFELLSERILEIGDHIALKRFTDLSTSV
ncbi:MAG: hypothetical protein ISR58_09465 [Anaerolineales bacterium]|nr:hypothetical protein [Chloroflexota bacterium]MBL6981404.1 hypothetical protein [Anaerolineales bacterium]